MSPRDEKHFKVAREFDGARLDAALILAFPELGLRKRRGLWERMDIRVQGVARPPSFKVRSGHTITICPDVVCPEEQAVLLSKIHVVAASSLFAAVFKPAGVHSVRGKNPGSVEEVVADLFPGEDSFLLNRLDFLTSGLILVGRSLASRSNYLNLQDRGLVRKIYLALVCGQVGDQICIKRAIDSSKRNKVRVLTRDTDDSIRHTVITPLKMIEDQTLVRAEIRKGQRHQIRAHLAAFGHPIVGDPLYGEGEGQGDSTHTMFLHHLEVVIQDFRAFCLPEWDMDVRAFIG
jgi:23S rRNA pseudouridine1911/1915/1917 synthase